MCVCVCVEGMFKYEERSGDGKKSRQQRRREARAEEEAAHRENVAALAAERSTTAREDEARAIAQALRADGLRVHEVPADGHCLYAAVAHQLAGRGGPGQAALRRLAAE